MSEELYYRHYFLQIYEILREDEQNKKLSIKEKNVLADDDEILKGGMKAPVRTLYEELKADKNITSSQKFIPGVEAYRPITWNDALYGNKMTEDDVVENSDDNIVLHSLFYSSNKFSIWTNKDFTRSRSFSRTNNSLRFQLIHQVRGAIESNF